MKLTKHHGWGNDFLITWVDEIPADAAELARRICDRHSGVGADGLVFGVGSHPLQFVLHNADGSAAEVSGNGLRCFGQAIAMMQRVDELTVTVATEAGPREIVVLGPDALRPYEYDVEVDMGVAVEGPPLEGRDPARHVPATRSMTVDMGNPHVVIEVADPMRFDMTTVGPQIEAEFTPVGANVHLVEFQADGIVMNIWERGAGATRACGSGACAVAFAAHAWGWTENAGVVVRMPGGDASVSVGLTLRLRGPAVYVGTVEIPDVAVTVGARPRG